VGLLNFPHSEVTDVKEWHLVFKFCIRCGKDN